LVPGVGMEPNSLAGACVGSADEDEEIDIGRAADQFRVAQRGRSQVWPTGDHMQLCTTI
jgi:hypothetical protein